MNKIRIFIRNDGSLVPISFMWKNKKEDETDKQFMDRKSIDHPNFIPELKTIPYKDVLEDDILKYAAPDIVFDQFYIEDNSPHGDIKIDRDWEILVKPSALIKRELINDLKDEIDKELIKESFDIVKISKLESSIRKSISNKNMNSVEWLEKALEGLDKRVASGKPDKPIVREKILKKIEELKNPKPVIIQQVKSSPKVIEGNVKEEINKIISNAEVSGVDPQMEPNPDLQGGYFSKYYKDS